MTRRRAATDVSTQLDRIARVAKEDKKVRFTSLAHLLTPEHLKASFAKLSAKAAPGIDGVTMQAFRDNLDAEIEQLWLELRRGTYRASPVRRSMIPKANGKRRALGIPTVRDRTVQRAVAEILGAVYEADYLDISHGFRPRRSAHTALESLRVAVDRHRIGWVIDADIERYFDTVNHTWLRRFLEHRIADRTLLHLIGKWLKSGIMDGGIRLRSDEGTPQGGPLSPLLANIYLHYVLDLWFERKVKPRQFGVCHLIRYADDFIVCFAHRGEAERFRLALEERLAKFGLTLSAEKTKLMEFGKTASHNGEKGPGAGPRSFDFLGFTHYMRRRPKRGWRLARKPSRKSSNAFLAKTKAWLVKHRDGSVWFQAYALARKLKGFYGYFALRHCLPSLRHIKWHTERLWIGALRRRSQRHRLFWSQVVRRPWFHLLPDPKRRAPA